SHLVKPGLTAHVKLRASVPSRPRTSTRSQRHPSAYCRFRASPPFITRHYTEPYVIKLGRPWLLNMWTLSKGRLYMNV
ncbi:hypothetical protein M9458_026695, partial [Cirrhinus mrigala]